MYIENYVKSIILGSKITIQKSDKSVFTNKKNNPLKFKLNYYNKQIYDTLT